MNVKNIPLCHTAKDNCEHFKYNRGKAMCYFDKNRPQHIPDMYKCPLIKRTKRGNKYENQEKLF